MKVKTKTFVSFLKKVKMEKSQQIDECILAFGTDGLKINANSASKQSRVMGWLKKEAFKEYEELGNVGINDMANVVRVLERFGELITLKKEGNLLTISGDSKKVDIELISEEFLNTDTGEPNLEFENTFTISMPKLKDIIKDVEMNKDAIMILETGEKKVSFSNTGKYKFRTEVDAPSCTAGVKVKFGSPLIDVVTNLDAPVEISVKSDHPAKVMEKTETSVVTIIVAPRVEDD